MGCVSNMGMLVVFLAMVGSLMVEQTRSATSTDCASKLVSCADYLNSTNPPSSCCTPLKEAVENERDCLCTLYNNPTLLSSYGINVTQARELPQHCGFSSSDSNICTNSTSAPSPNTSKTPSASSGDGNSSAVKITWPAVTSLLLFLVSYIVY